MGYFCSSDWHFGHRQILEFERDRFQKIEEHDQFLLKTIRNYFQCNIGVHDTFYFLGDLGVPTEAVASSLYAIFADAPFKKVAVLGNHDGSKQKRFMREVFDEVYEYPVYISNTVVLSHYPVAVYDCQVNIHGHLHASYLADRNHINASVAVANYKFVQQSHVDRIKKTFDTQWSPKFLHEPYAKDYVFTDMGRADVVTDRLGKVNLEASLKLRGEM